MSPSVLGVVRCRCQDGDGSCSTTKSGEALPSRQAVLLDTGLGDGRHPTPGGEGQGRAIAAVFGPSLSVLRPRTASSRSVGSVQRGRGDPRLFDGFLKGDAGFGCQQSGLGTRDRHGDWDRRSGNFTSQDHQPHCSWPWPVRPLQRPHIVERTGDDPDSDPGRVQPCSCCFCGRTPERLTPGGFEEAPHSRDGLLCTYGHISTRPT